MGAACLARKPEGSAASSIGYLAAWKRSVWPDATSRSADEGEVSRRCDGIARCSGAATPAERLLLRRLRGDDARGRWRRGATPPTDCSASISVSDRHASTLDRRGTSAVQRSAHRRPSSPRRFSTMLATSCLRKFQPVGGARAREVFCPRCAFVLALRVDELHQCDKSGDGSGCRSGLRSSARETRDRGARRREARARLDVVPQPPDESSGDVAAARPQQDVRSHGVRRVRAVWSQPVYDAAALGGRRRVCHLRLRRAAGGISHVYLKGRATADGGIEQLARVVVASSGEHAAAAQGPQPGALPLCGAAFTCKRGSIRPFGRRSRSTRAGCATRPSSRAPRSLRVRECDDRRHRRDPPHVRDDTARRARFASSSGRRVRSPGGVGEREGAAASLGRW